MPLSKMGITLVVLHHEKKPSSDPKAVHSARAAILGAQTFGAASSRIYSLERVECPPSMKHTKYDFSMVLKALGSWTPVDDDQFFIHVREVELKKKTTVEILNRQQQLALGTGEVFQQVGIQIAEIVRKRQAPVQRQEMFQLVKEQFAELSINTFRSAERLALSQGWIKKKQLKNVKHKPVIFVPGEVMDE